MPYKDKANQLAAQRRHYAANKEYYFLRNKKQKQKLRDEVAAYKESYPCADCDLFYPSCVMDFDHTGDKTDNISRMIETKSRKAVFAEITKCDLICANCHRIRTWRRMQLSPMA